MKTITKKIAVSVVACMVLSGNVYGTQTNTPLTVTTDQVNPFELRQAQIEAINDIKKNFKVENVPYASNADAKQGVVNGTNLSGQCLSFVKNSRPELQLNPLNKHQKNCSLIVIC